MIDEERKFSILYKKYIVCPNCKNDKNFKLMAEKLEPGIFEMKIGCAKCDWRSDAILEDSGYFPDMGNDMMSFCVCCLHEEQTSKSI